MLEGQIGELLAKVDRKLRGQWRFFVTTTASGGTSCSPIMMKLISKS